MEQKTKPRVGIFTTFYNFDTAYSLCTVVEQQLKMLVKHGYNPILYVLNIFNDDSKVPEGVEVRKTIPQLMLEPYGKGDLSNYNNDVEKAQKALEESMSDMNVVLTHDIIFINSYLPYNRALRLASREDRPLSHVKWLHWMHSGPSIRPQMDGSPYDDLYTLPRNSRLVYMNYTDAIRAAEMYGIFEKDVRVVSNPMDIRILHNFHPLTNKLIDKFDLMSADIIDVYPLSTTRMGDGGKQIDYVVKIMAELKKLGKTVRLVVCNAHANGEREKEAIKGVYDLAVSLGLEKREVIFTSFYDVPNYEHGVPHEVIRDMFLLSNLFIFPSVSENCPLVLLEAMAGKNLLVLNQSFPAMKDFGGLKSLYFRFGSLVETPHYPLGLDLYLSDIAKIIVAELNNDRTLNSHSIVKKKFNVDYIFKQQLEPAIMEIYYGI